MSQSPSEQVQLTNAELSAAIDPHGAQLMSLRTVAAQELIWQGNPASWPDRAPILFPVIGPVVDGQIHHAGRSYPMPPHGFARERDFTITEKSETRCVFELRADAETRRHYPFAFVLRVEFALSAGGLQVTIEVENQDSEALPADVGFHPGFNWPLAAGTTKEDYAVVFTEPEPAPIRRGVDDPIFLVPEPRPTPVEGSVLCPRDEMFQDNAMVFDQLNSRSLTFGPYGAASAQRAVGLHIEFPDSPYLAIWSKPGASFLAIEPWHGLPSPVDFDGPLANKPGIASIAPGETRRWRLRVSINHSEETRR